MIDQMMMARNQLIAGSLILILGLVNGNSIEAPTKLTLSPSHDFVTRYVSDAIIITCSGDSNGKVRWVNPQGKTVTNTSGPLHVEGQESLAPGALALVFEKARVSDKGNWTCETEDKAHSISFTLTILEPISFVDTPKVQTGKENETAIIKCVAKGIPQPSIQWYRDGVSIISNSSKYQKDEKKGLKIKNLTADDKGNYTCKAFQVSETKSDVMEEVIEFNVFHMPIPVKKLPLHATSEPAYGYIPGSVNLTCAAIAEPAAQFVWFRNNKRVSANSGRIFEDSNQKHISVLMVDLHDQSALGDYRCEARNSIGTLQRIITLYEGHRPEIPQNINLNDANADTMVLTIPDIDAANISSTASPNTLPIIGYKFQYMVAPDIMENLMAPKNAVEDVSNYITEFVTSSAKVPDYINEVLWHNSTEVDFKISEKYLITGLDHATVYAIRAMSRNEAGYSYPSTVKYYATKDAHPHSVHGGASAARPSQLLLSTIMSSSLLLIISTCIKQKYAYCKSESVADTANNIILTVGC